MTSFHVTSDAFRAAAAGDRPAGDPAAAAAEGAGQDAPVPAASPGPGEDAGLIAERERLARELRDARMQLAMTQQRLTALQQSATMVLGKTLVSAAKRPWPRGAQLPRDLYRMWRDRGAPGKSGGATLAIALAAAQLNDLKGTGGRFLSQLTPPGALALNDPALLVAGHAAAGGAEHPRLVITGALTPLACATLAPDAVVHPLLPHDADIVVEATGADLVLIEAAALLPGAPWAYATDSAGADRGRRLARMIVLARSLGKPVVLVRNVPPALLPGLGWVASSCDAVTNEGLGVQLARFNPVALPVARPTAPLYAGERDRRESPRVRELLDALTAGPDAPLAVTGARSWRALPELYRSSATFVTASAGQAREQAACGARVIGPVGGAASPAAADAGALASQLSAAATAAPRDIAEVRGQLREIFAEHATPVRLAAIARAAKLDGALVGGRQVAVLAAARGAADASRLAAALLRQRLRPAEAVVATSRAQVAEVRDALIPLVPAGITVRVTAVPSRARRGAPGEEPAVPGTRAAPGGTVPLPLGEPAVPGTLGELATLASAPWAAPWPPEGGEAAADDAYLLDLACARECAQADAACFGEADYELTRRLASPALARRELFLPGSPAPDSWGARGLRLITIKGAR